MIQDELRQRQCGRRKMYPDTQTARNAIEDMRAKTHRSVHFGIIHCIWCGMVHIGRISKERARRQNEILGGNRNAR